MAQLVTIEDAARRALAAWLRTELAAVADLVVEPDWFENDRQLPPKAISVIDAGPREMEWLQTEVLHTAMVGETQVDAAWGFGFITQPIQIDIWARSKPELSDLVARLDAALNKDALGLGITNANPFSAGLLLNLGDGWAPGTVDFEFGSVLKSQSATSVGEGEWRAMVRGTATAQMVQVARTARIARILLKQKLAEGAEAGTTIIQAELPTDPLALYLPAGYSVDGVNSTWVAAGGIDFLGAGTWWDSTPRNPMPVAADGKGGAEWTGSAIEDTVSTDQLATDSPTPGEFTTVLPLGDKTLAAVVDLQDVPYVYVEPFDDVPNIDIANQGLLLGDGFSGAGLYVVRRGEGTSGDPYVYWLFYAEIDNSPDYIRVAQVEIPALPMRVVAQGRKRNGHVEVRLGDGSWVVGDTCGDMFDRANLLAAVGPGKGTIRALAAWDRPLTDEESDDVAAWGRRL